MATSQGAEMTNPASRLLYDTLMKDAAATHFKVLPDPIIYPDYYAVITRPVCLSDMWKSVSSETSRYTLNDMQRDLRRMVANAKRYNRPDAPVYQDALSLERTIRRAIKDIERDGPEDEDEDAIYVRTNTYRRPNEQMERDQATAYVQAQTLKRNTAAAQRAARKEEGDPDVENAFRYFIGDGDLFKRGAESFHHYHQRKLGRLNRISSDPAAKRKRDEGAMLAASAGQGRAPLPHGPGSMGDPTRRSARQEYEHAHARKGAVGEDSAEEGVGGSASSRKRVASPRIASFSPGSAVKSVCQGVVPSPLPMCATGQAIPSQPWALPGLHILPADGGYAYVRVRIGSDLHPGAARALLPADFVLPALGLPSRHRRECRLCAPSLLEGKFEGRKGRSMPSAGSERDTDGAGLGLLRPSAHAPHVLIPRVRVMSKAELAGVRGVLEGGEGEEVPASVGRRGGRLPSKAVSASTPTLPVKRKWRVGTRRGGVEEGDDQDADDEYEEEEEDGVEDEEDGEDGGRRPAKRAAVDSASASGKRSKGKERGGSLTPAHTPAAHVDATLDAMGYNIDISRAFWANYTQKRPNINLWPDSIVNVARAARSDTPTKGARQTANSLGVSDARDASSSSVFSAPGGAAVGTGAGRGRGPRASAAPTEFYGVQSFTYGACTAQQQAYHGLSAGAGAHPHPGGSGVHPSGAGAGSGLREVGRGMPLGEYRDDWKFDKWLIRKRVHYCETHAADAEGEQAFDEEFILREREVAPIMAKLFDAHKKASLVEAAESNASKSGKKAFPSTPGGVTGWGGASSSCSFADSVLSALNRTVGRQVTTAELSRETTTNQAMAMAMLHGTPAPGMSVAEARSSHAKRAHGTGGGSSTASGKRARFSGDGDKDDDEELEENVDAPGVAIPDVSFAPSHIGAMMDVEDGSGCWWLAQVIDTAAGTGTGSVVKSIKVHYHGWPDENDDWIDLPAPDVIAGFNAQRAAEKAGRSASLSASVRAGMASCRIAPALSRSSMLANTCGECKNKYAGSMIFCDDEACGQGFHLACLKPPLTKPPTVPFWLCPKHKDPRAHGGGIGGGKSPSKSPANKGKK